MYFTDGERAWLYAYPNPGAGWLAGASLAYRRSLWERHRFEARHAGEDTRFVFGTRTRRVDLADPALVISGVHAGNTSLKCRGASWCPVPVREMTGAHHDTKAATALPAGNAESSATGRISRTPLTV